jgi:hypothetical protein
MQALSVIDSLNVHKPVIRPDGDFIGHGFFRSVG